MSSVEISRSVCPTWARIQRSGSVPEEVCSCASCSASCCSSDSVFARRLRGLQPLLQPRDRLGKPRELHGLHEVVEHALREGLHRVVVVGRDEHEVRAPPDLARRLDAVDARHLHVEEADVRAASPRRAAPPRGRCAPRATISSSGQACASWRASASRSSGSSSAISAVGRAAISSRPRARETRAPQTTPCGSRARTRSDAASPNTSARRSRSAASPVPRPRPEACRPAPESATRIQQRPSTTRTSTAMLSAFLGRIDAVAHRVLDQRQQRHRRAAQAARRILDVELEREPVRQAHAHELEVGPHQLDLLAERRHRLVEPRHRRAQVGDEAAQHVGRLRRARFDQRLDVRERVEQEVRRHLRLQQVQSRIERQPVRLAAREVERERLLARERFLLPHQRAERDPGRHEKPEAGQRAEAFHARLVLPEGRRAGLRGEHLDDRRSRSARRRRPRRPAAPSAAASAAGAAAIARTGRRPSSRRGRRHEADHRGPPAGRASRCRIVRPSENEKRNVNRTRRQPKASARPRGGAGSDTADMAEE